MNMKEQILSISEAAEYLGVFTLTLRTWEKKGMLKAFRTLGGHRRYKKSDLDKIIEGTNPAQRVVNAQTAGGISDTTPRCLPLNH